MARKPAPHHGRKWLTEAEISDRLQQNDYELLQECTLLENATWLREPVISNGLMPDFVCLGNQPDYGPNCQNSGQPWIHVIEVKITADAFSIVQLLHYANLLRMHGNWWRSSKNHGPFVGVSMSLIARYFDKSVIPFIEAASLGTGLELSAHRIQVEKSGDISLEFETDHTRPWDGEAFDATLSKFLPTHLNKSEGADGAPKH